MTDLPVKPHLLTIYQVSIIIMKSERTVREYISEGKLKGHNPNGIKNGAKGLRITVESVKDYLRKFELDEFNDAEFDKTLDKIAQRPSKMRVISSGIQI